MSKQSTESLLSPYKVLDLTDEKGLICGKILGDLGADVIKIEPPEGDSSRNIGPFYKDIPDPEKSLFWFAYNTSKRGITLNINSIEGQEIFKKLAENADFVIESYDPGQMDKLGLGYEALNRINPGIILTSITPFGQDGPYKDYKGADIVCWALGGMAYLCGDPDRAPIQVSFPQSYLHAGANAAAASNIALYHRQITGEGQHIDVSALACVPWCTMNSLEYWPLLQSNVKRAGPYRERPAIDAKDRQIWPCRDGFVHFLILGGVAGSYMPRFFEWMIEVGAADEFIKSLKWEEFDASYLPQEVYDALEKPIGDFFSKYTMKEIYEGAIKRKVHLYPVSNTKELAENEQLKSRGFWKEIEHAELGETITYPGSFLKLSDAECGIRHRAPLIGEHNEEIFINELGFSREDLKRLEREGVI